MMPRFSWTIIPKNLFLLSFISAVVHFSLLDLARAQADEGSGKQAESSLLPPVELLPPPGPAEKKPKEALEVAGRRLAAQRDAAKGSLPNEPRTACLAEAKALCGDAEGATLNACLAQNVEDVSRLCLMALRPYAVEVVTRACGADARLLCMGVGRKGMRACLTEQAAALSMPCRSMLPLMAATLGKSGTPTKVAAVAGQGGGK